MNYYWLPLYVLVGYASLSFVAAFVSVLQEFKLWQAPVPKLSLFGMLKIYFLNVTWMVFCLLGSIFICIKCLVTLQLNAIEIHGHNVKKLAAEFVLYWFVAPIEVRGIENLPKVDDASSLSSPAPIYIANHASQVDAAVVYCIDRRFRWIAKQSILFLPGVGQIMYLAGDIFIDRVKKRGARSLYEKSNASIQEGVPMFIFPQGTRRILERLPFKDGAFKISMQNEAKLVPISLNIPTTMWNSMYPFTKAPNKIIVTIHEPIPTKSDMDMEKLKQQCFDKIYSVLPDYAAGGGTNENNKKKD